MNKDCSKFTLHEEWSKIGQPEKTNLSSLSRTKTLKNNSLLSAFVVSTFFKKLDILLLAVDIPLVLLGCQGIINKHVSFRRRNGPGVALLNQGYTCIPAGRK